MIIQIYLQNVNAKKALHIFQSSFIREKSGSCECLNYKPMDREHIPQHEQWQWVKYYTKESSQIEHTISILHYGKW